MASAAEDPSEARQKQLETRLNAQNAAPSGSGDTFEEVKAHYLDKLADAGLSDAGADILDNMVDQSMALGNLSAAEVHEIKWRLHVMYIKIKANFPHQESDIQGKLRAYYFDNRDEDITALTDKQKIIISQMLIGISVFISRSKQGFQQEKLVEQIRVSEVRNPDDNQDDGLVRGLVS